MNAELSLSRANRTLLDQESTVLVFVDVQQRLLQHIHGRETVLENCIRLARFAHVLELPVLVCEQQKLGPTAEPLRLALEQGGFYAPIPKVRFSCMDVEDFAAALKKTGRSTPAARRHRGPHLHSANRVARPGHAPCPCRGRRRGLARAA